MKKSIFLIFLFTFFQVNMALAHNENIALITGMLYKHDTREPIQTTIYFVDDAGDIIKAQSEINGQYSIVLPSGKDYVVVTEGYIALNTENTLSIPKKKEYQEITMNMELNTISKGDVICTANAFTSNSNVINDEGLLQLLKLKQFLISNSNVKLNIYISAEDTYFAGKKGKKGHSMESLLDKRASTLRDVLTSMRIKELSYEITTIPACASKPIKAAKKGKKKTNNTDNTTIITLKVEIAKILRL